MTTLLAERTRLRLPADHPPVLLVVIDTEEEFDWSAPFDRGQTSVEAMRDAWRAQELFDAFGIRATWVADYPIVTQPAGYEFLRELVDTGRGTVGAHLHPWVSPPHEEPVNARNSYPGNLPPDLEERKLWRLTDAIEHYVGLRPTVYKAGRYGFGPHTADLLERLGYEVDLSPCAAFDLGADGGPDWSRFDAAPYRFGRARDLVGLPTSGAFVGWLAGAGPALHAASHRAPWAGLRVPGILSRTGALERLLLSPEGYRLEHLKRLTRALLACGTRVLSFSFHSPSLRPGCTSYVRSETELKEFLSLCRQFFEFFLGELGGATMGPLELRQVLLDPPRTTAP
ncbi:MAG: polysaccharide deacetylase family protein [Planctomycetes bacterium]|nr:polysaccharide deacetylase family protein [Planctomycetota bacterium]